MIQLRLEDDDVRSFSGKDLYGVFRVPVDYGNVVLHVPLEVPVTKCKFTADKFLVVKML
jgi:hypothetical protein